MAFRFWRRVKIAPGISLNLSKSGGSLSFGPRGAKFTIGPRGARATAGIPGTGLFYTTTLPAKRTRKSSRSSRSYTEPPAPTVPKKDRLNLSFFQRLLIPAGEEALVDGCRELAQENEEGALEHLRNATHLPDGAFMAGFLALKKNLPDEAAQYLEIARRKYAALGSLLKEYGIQAVFSIAITPEVTAHVGPDSRGVLLGLVEAYQLQESNKKALECLQQLLRLEPDDIVVKLSLAELLFDAAPNDRRACQKIVQLSAAVDNETALHAALLLYKAKALAALGLFEAARETLADGLRKRAGRPEELLRSLRYQRALVCEALGDKRGSRSELERLYAEAPDYEDVSSRLGL